MILGFSLTLLADFAAYDSVLRVGRSANINALQGSMSSNQKRRLCLLDLRVRTRNWQDTVALSAGCRTVLEKRQAVHSAMPPHHNHRRCVLQPLSGAVERQSEGRSRCEGSCLVAHDGRRDLGFAHQSAVLRYSQPHSGPRKPCPSARYRNAKINFGYRADFFFNAMDGGQDTAKSYGRGFYGPYLNLSIGLP